MEAAVFIGALIVVIFVVDLVGRWWRENEWRRRWRRARRRLTWTYLEAATLTAESAESAEPDKNLKDFSAGSAPPAVKRRVASDQSRSKSRIGLVTGSSFA